MEVIFSEKYTILRVQPRKFFCFISKIQLYMNSLMKQVKFFNFFSSHFFNVKNIE